MDRRPGGGFLLRSGHALQPFARCVGDWLETWAARAPARPFLVAREAGGARREVGYGEAGTVVRALAQALLDLGAAPDRPLLLLSDNGIDHALLQLAAMHAGIPAAPVSSAYSLASHDFGKLRDVTACVGPGAVYAEDAALFGRALDALDLPDVPLIVSRRPPAGRAARTVRELASTTPGDRARRAFEAVGPGTIAKILFTSGSTGSPKGIVNTQRMLCSNQQAIAQIWPFVERRPPVVVDWLPWSHTFGGNHNFNLVLRNGGTLHIDRGRPTPAGIETTAANLRDGVADDLLQRAARLRHALAAARRRRGARGFVLRGARPRVLCGGGAAAASLDAAGDTGRPRPRRPAARAVRVGLGLDRDRAARHVGPLPDRSRRRDRPAGARLRTEVRAVARQAGDARARPERDAGLLAAGRTGAAGRGRRGRVPGDGRRRPARGSGLADRRCRLRRPNRRELQAVVGDVGVGRRAARAARERLRAACSGSRRRRARSRRARGAAVRRPRDRGGRHPRRRARRPARPQPGASGCEHARRARALPAGAAVGRPRRDHRQGLHQPARRADRPAGRGRTPRTRRCPTPAC